MKKLLFLLLIIFTVNVSGQWTPKKATEVGSKKTFVANGDSAANLTFIAGGTLTAVITTLPGQKTYMDIRNSWDWARFAGGYQDSCTSQGDSLVPIASEWWSFSIIPDDTIKVSFERGYPADDDILIMPNQEYKVEKLNYAYKTKLYFKVYGWGIATVRARWYAF